MNQQKTASSSSRQKEYARLRAQLAHTEWISEGYVQARGPGSGGACYPWTRKVKGKTICVALSKEQYDLNPAHLDAEKAHLRPAKWVFL